MALAALAALALSSLQEKAWPAERDIYPPPSEARSDIAAALKVAAASNKRVILDFGGNWCADCHVLDYYLHDPVNKALLDADFILVHVNIGRSDTNLDLTVRYRISLMRGVPAMAVLSSRGALLFSQSGEFEQMRYLRSGAVTEFLQHWSPRRPKAS
jgi:thioredoxin 1